MRLIIAGSRDLTDRHLVEPFIDAFVKSTLGTYPEAVLSGKCTGVDAIGERWAGHYSIPVEDFPADWSTGKSAGPRRNAAMVAKADALLCIHYPDSRGSADVLRQARDAGLLVVEVVVPRPR